MTDPENISCTICFGASFSLALQIYADCPGCGFYSLNFKVSWQDGLAFPDSPAGPGVNVPPCIMYRHASMLEYGFGR